MGVIQYIGPTVDLVKAATRLPADFRVQEEDRLWLVGIADPLSAIVALAANDAAGPLTVGEDEAAVVAAFQGVNAEYRALVEVTASRLARAAAGETVLLVGDGMDTMAANAGLDPATWALIIQMALQLIEIIRKRRQGQ